MRTQLGIALILFCNGTALYGQSFSQTEWDKISLGILNQNAQNRKLVAVALLDSMTISSLNSAYFYKDSALNSCQMALKESDRIAQDFHATADLKDKELGQAKKEIRKQKALKWLGFGLAVVIGIISVAK